VYNSLAQQTIFAERKSKCQASVPSSKNFWLWLQPSQIASVPTPDSGSTALGSTTGENKSHFQTAIFEQALFWVGYKMQLVKC